MIARGVASLVVVTALAALGGSAIGSTGTSIKVMHGTRLTGGPWVRLARATSPHTRAAADVRGFRSTPAALAFTVTVTPAQRVKVFWSVSCDDNANDQMFTPQGSFKFMAPLSAYPPVLANGTNCVLTVRATPTHAGKARATVFAR